MGTKVKTKNAGVVDVKGGKAIEAKDIDGIKDETPIVVFKYNERVKFKVEHAKDSKSAGKHVPEGTVIEMHVLDAAIAEKLGKGKVVGDKLPSKPKGVKP